MGRKRIVKPNIKFISLVPLGANRMPVIYKSDNSLQLQPLVKFDEEKGELLTLVYVADYTDSQGHYAKAEDIKEMLYSHQRNGASLDLRHDNETLTKDQAFIAETFLVDKSDSRFQDWTDIDGEKVDAEGAWAMVVKIDDPELRRKYRSGWNGVSMQGECQLVPDEEPAQKSAPETGKKELNMDKEEMRALLKEFGEALIEGLSKALNSDDTDGGGKPEPDEPKKEETSTIEFEGRPTDPEAVKEHLKKLRLSKVDWSDEASVKTYLDEISETTKEDPVEEEISGLQSQIDALRKGSRQPTAAKNENKEELYNAEGLSKAELEGAKVGRKLGKLLTNGRL